MTGVQISFLTRHRTLKILIPRTLNAPYSTVFGSFTFAPRTARPLMPTSKLSSTMEIEGQAKERAKSNLKMQGAQKTLEAYS